ncbi:MAG: hypothetical protein A2Y98_02190 [Candidatus Portnoybacteria bacterium RBG_19FT_COMBO_36_7]|uniref:Uncharacterized protein n=1 Tax=Candidatus Portnoybacteria bacterium RBG_19FT_COMBO_36_7 TaxID=1801992 RepID=A0A1G2F9A2_9BACT|nr:MAG: hypothetical protein A2Y98_02190 [Candidatus Portnoybacteria bacterium RBG_19FT_COMBO_36_7]
MSKLKKLVSITTSFTTIAMVSGVAMLAPLAAGAVVTGVNEGDMIKTATSPDIYIAKYVGSKQFKRLILSPTVFNSYQHLKWENVKTVDQATLDQFIESTLVRAEGDPKVYNLFPTPNSDVGGKHWVNMTAEAFTACGLSNTLFDWDSIYQINAVDRDNYAASNDDTTCTLSGEGITPGPAGALSVALASDTPVAGMAPASAARVGFTKVNLTASSAGAVTITGITVQRTGLAVDAAISTVMLIDTADNSQIGLNQALNANHQAIFPDTITIPAGTTKSILIAANMPSVTSTYAGQVVTLSLVGVSTASSVSGALPITGNYMTINGSLSIGSATVSVGSLDPLTASANKNVGTTAFKFSGLRITAGSVEDVTVASIRWNQSGSAASSDLANVKVSDGTTDYATTVSSDGKYYTASFGAGVVIAKGLNKEFTISGDIINGSGRTVSFDIYRNTDIVVKGNTYGYYIVLSFGTTDYGTPGNTNTFIDINASPYFGGSDVTIGGGALRVDKSTTGAPTANITRGATGQILGSFDFVVQGEEVRPTSIILDIDITAGALTGNGSSSDITNIVLAKADGTVLAGPVNGGADTTTANPDSTATFTGSVSLPVGTTQVLVKGNVGTDFVAGDTIAVGFATPQTRITGATGAITGNSITVTPNSNIYGNIMTIRGGTLAVHIGGTPVAQSVIAGTQGYIFSNIIFDASASGEDVRVTQVVLRNAYTTATDVFGVQLFDDTTALNTGSNIITPSAAANPGANTVTFDNPLVITKGTSKTIAVKGNILATAATGNTQRWGFTDGVTTNVTATGVSTGQTVTVNTTTSEFGAIMTIAAAGQWSVALDSSSPTGRLIAANTTGNIVTALRFRATSEQINITKLRLSLTSASSSWDTVTTASSTCNDIAKVYVYGPDETLLNAGGSVLGIGNAIAGSTNASSTIVFTTPLVLPANTDKVVRIKVDIASMDDTSNPTAIAGHQLAINFWPSTSTSENEATGMSSGAKIANYSTVTAQPYAYIYRSVPTVSKLDVSTTKLSNSDMDLLKFRVAADAKGDIDLYKFTFRISTTVANVTYFNLVDVTSGGNTVLYASSTQLIMPGVSTNDIDVVLMASPGTPGGTATPRTVSAGTYRDFVVRGTVTGATTNATVVTYLRGDTSPRQAWGTHMTTAAGVDATAIPDVDDNFIWSDFSKAAHSTATADWTNGYLVSGLPASGLTAQTLSF